MIAFSSDDGIDGAFAVVVVVTDMVLLQQKREKSWNIRACVYKCGYVDGRVQRGYYCSYSLLFFRFRNDNLDFFLGLSLGVFACLSPVDDDDEFGMVALLFELLLLSCLPFVTGVLCEFWSMELRVLSAED